MMRKEYKISFIALLMLFAVVVSAASAETITIGSKTFTAAGETGDIDLYWDSAPNGIYGYMFNITMSDTSVAEFTAVKGPAWADVMHALGLAQWGVAAPDDCFLKVLAVSSINKGDTNIYLGTITVKATGPGTATVTVDTAGLYYEVSDQDGSKVVPSIVDGIIQVGPVVTDKGSIEVTSTPAGAAIWLDGADTTFVTPYTLTDIDVGDHTVKVVGVCGDENSATVTVVKDQTVPAAFTLSNACKPGNLIVTSTPAGAAIWLNGEDSTFVTPHTFQVGGGDYVVKVVYDAYCTEASKTVTVVPETDVSADFTLIDECIVVPDMGSIDVTSTPAGAAIYLDGSDIGQVTPYTIADVLVGDHTVKVVLGDFCTEDSMTVTVVKDTTVPAAFTLADQCVYTGGIEVTSTPAGAAIWLDGADTGFVTPKTFTEVALGDHTVKVVLADYCTEASQTVTVKADMTAIAAFTLVDECVVPTTGFLAVTSSPAGATILLNDADTGFVTPHTFELDAGEVKVSVQKDCYITPEPVTATINVGETTPVPFELVFDENNPECTTPTPEFPSMLVPAISLIGVLGAIMLARKKN